MFLLPFCVLKKGKKKKGKEKARIIIVWSGQFFCIYFKVNGIRAIYILAISKLFFWLNPACTWIISEADTGPVHDNLTFGDCAENMI